MKVVKLGELSQSDDNCMWTMPESIEIDGFRVDSIGVQEMDGDAEEAYYSKGLSPQKRTDKLIESCLVSVGGETRTGKVDNFFNKFLSEISVGAKEFISIAIRVATRGEELQMDLDCPHCREALETDLDLLQELDVIVREEDSEAEVSFDLKRKFVWEGKTYTKGTALVPQVKIASSYTGLIMKNPVAGEYALLARVLKLDGYDDKITNKMARKLGTLNKDYIMDLLSKHSPGPVYRGEFDCNSCGQLFKAPYNLRYFLALRETPAAF